MIFDLFHSISDPVLEGKRLGAAKAFAHFLSQARLADSLGFDTLWAAESHFSSEIQKKNPEGSIPEFEGEVGLNGDSFQWIHVLFSQTQRLNAGVGIHNIVGGSGGPIASADRANHLRYYQRLLWERHIRLGIASGRFPYQNRPFGLVPRSPWEEKYWPKLKRYHFLEALEIFLRLMRGETLNSSETTLYPVPAELRTPDSPTHLEKRWTFEPLQLVPEAPPHARFHLVLGSADPLALELGLRYWDLDVFNLSFTSAEELEKIHARRIASHPQTWTRDRLPRTVLVFAHPDRKKAYAMADQVLDGYLRAMRGTAQVPSKEVLLGKALVGDAPEIREQMAPTNPRSIHPEDRLMLWFEFNQLETEPIERSMRYFMEEVAPHV